LKPRRSSRNRTGPAAARPSIHATLSRWLAAQTLVGLSLVSVFVYTATGRNLALKEDERFERQLSLVRHLMEEDSRPESPLVQHKLDDFFAANTDNALLLTSGDRVVYRSAQVPGAGWTTRCAQFDAGTQVLQLRLSLDPAPDRRLLARLAWTLLLTTVVGSLLVSGTSALLVRRGLRPLRQLAHDTAAAGPAAPGLRIDASRYAPELQQWIGQFNALLQRVEEAYVQMESFNADVAHELRTPLSNMMAHIEVELGVPRSTCELEDALQSQLEEAQRLTAIVSDMLFLSRADRGGRARREAPQSVAAQIHDVADYFDALLEARQFAFEVVGDARIAMDTGLVRRAISNLLGNAIAHGTPATTIRARVARTADQVSIVMENTGPGLAPEAQARLFERFYRVDSSRADSAQHHGLGLAIVAAIARMHRGGTFATSVRGTVRIGMTLADPEGATLSEAPVPDPGRSDSR